VEIDLQFRGSYESSLPCILCMFFFVLYMFFFVLCMFSFVLCMFFFVLSMFMMHSFGEDWRLVHLLYISCMSSTHISCMFFFVLCMFFFVLCMFFFVLCMCMMPSLREDCRLVHLHVIHSYLECMSSIHISSVCHPFISRVCHSFMSRLYVIHSYFERWTSRKSSEKEYKIIHT